jgi:hypothetical protein
MIGPLSFARLPERGRAILTWGAAGGGVDRLATLARRVTAGRGTDWPGRPPGPEPRTTDGAGAARLGRGGAR